MAFDLAWGFRSSSGYVTDPAYQVPCLGEAYPHTYTNGNGDSVNGGFNTAPGTIDGSSSNDPRIAGINYFTNSALDRYFQVDLSSGSAPGAGAYTVDLAFGYQGSAQTQDFELRDNTTVLIDGTNGGAGYATAGNHFIDATLADVTGGAAWTGATASKTFATTTVKLAGCMHALSNSTCWSHFRLTLQGGGGTDTPITPPTAVRIAA